MKKIILIATVLFAQAHAEAMYSCEANLDDEYTPGSITSIHMDFDDIASNKSTGQRVLTNVKVDVNNIARSNNVADFETESAEAKVLASDKNYSPRKYEGSHRFNLVKLKPTNVPADKNSDYYKKNFLPSDSCEIQVIMPRNWADGEEFEAPVLIHCDQSGGKAIMTCSQL